MGPSAYILAILMLNAVYAAPPVEKKPDEVVILEQENNFNGVDPWRWSNMTSSNESKDESGELTDDGVSVELPDNSNITMNNQSHEESAELEAGGDAVKLPDSYTWTSPEGITCNVTYIEDEDLGVVPVFTQQGEGGEPSQEGGCDGGPPPEAGAAGRPQLSGNAALSLIGRRK